MKLKVLKKSDYTTTKWSGGDTTQLYIYPEDGNYIERNFLFRLSTATVTSEKSVFTELKGISRKLMVLSGEMKLEHKGRYIKELKEFQQDSFMGEWETISYGKVEDFNLMTKNPCTGKLKNIEVIPNSSIKMTLFSNKYNKVLKAFYPFGGSMKLLFGDEKIEVDEKNLVLIELDKNDEGTEVTISSNNCGLNIIVTEVIYG